MKTILVLAKTFDSGIHWENKHGHTLRDSHNHKWYVVYEPYDLQKFLQERPKIDVEGYILPEFTHNNRKQEMINLLYAHKKTLSHRATVDFMNNVILGYGKQLDLKGNDSKTWHGSQAQYDAIPTKDPNTLYNIVG